MKILDLIKSKQSDLTGQKPVTIAFLGDSVTQGCFECFLNGKGEIDTVFDAKCAYSARIKEILNLLFPRVQINIINSGISGDSAASGLKRLDRDVLSFNPDLVIVSYGLNDSNNSDITNYKTALDGIFSRLKKNGTEVIFLTQNFMNTEVSPHLKEDYFKNLALRFSQNIQNNGKLKCFFTAAKESCEKFGVKVCDLYSAWEKMYLCGVDVTELLANKLNHPVREFHYYMAIKLIETMFEI